MVTFLTSEWRSYLSIFVIWVGLPKSLKWDKWLRGMSSDTDKKLTSSSITPAMGPEAPGTGGNQEKSGNCSSSASLIAGNMPDSLASFNRRPLLMGLILTALSQGMHRKTPVPDWGNLQQEWGMAATSSRTQGKPQLNLFCSEAPQFRIISTTDLSWSKLILSQMSQVLAPLSRYEAMLA